MSKRSAAPPVVHALAFLLALVLVQGVLSHAAAPPFQSVAVTLAEDGGAYYEQIVRGAEHGAREVNPRVTFVAMSCHNNADEQMRQIDDLVQRGVDVILIQRSYQGDSSPAVQRARKAGVTVVAVDVDIPGGTDALVKPDERQGGMLAGRYMVRRLSGKGKVAIANGPASSGPLGLRVAGFVDELKKSPGIEIVENQDTGMSLAGTRAALASMLARHPDLDAVYGVNDPVAYYSELEALAEQRTQLFIVGMEGSPRSVAAMSDPQRLIVASPGADPFVLAETAAKLGAAVRAGTREAGATVLMPFVELSRDNVRGYRGWTR